MEGLGGLGEEIFDYFCRMICYKDLSAIIIIYIMTYEA